jgi:queuosine precursor transporter
MTLNPWKSLVPVLAMGFVILVSNELVQHPVQGNFLGVDLAGILTWGAFTYPAAFLVTDTTNRLFGMGPARRVVVIGFAFGVALTLIAALGIAAGVSRSGALSLWQALFRDPDAFAMLRTALASGSAFLTAQLLDIKVFDVLRRHAWWKAPLASSLVGSFIDTLIFFFLAFAGTGLPWGSWAVGDFCAKLIMIALLLYPFRLVVRYYPQPLQGTS